ncbi:MAG: hypothetical protein IPO66_23355 [Rhodanobacteraceae bacterium]|nr:hypothetical protein [Rhodanobacteraceae bacterium]
MSRPLISAVTLALLSALPGLSSAAPNQRFSASATLLPNATASGGRFGLQAKLLQPGAPLLSDAKQPEPARSQSVAETGLAARFKLLAAVRDKDAPTGSVCAAENVFQNGFE